MSSRNQNKPPPRIPLTKIDNQDDGPMDKRRKGLGGTMMGSTAASRRRQATGGVTNCQDASVGGTGDSGVNEEMESVKVEFTKEEVEALLNEKIKGKTYDFKGKMEQMGKHMNKLKLCIKWFQSNEELLKLDAINSHRSEKEARDALENLHSALTEEHQKAKQEILDINQKFSSVNTDHKRLQEYNKSLQHYNRQLQTDVANANESASFVALKMIELERRQIENCKSVFHYKSLPLASQIYSKQRNRGQMTR